eukprot:CAMPEP_0171515792 /NCGR_PEP_ID=MMETSP0959-20130129/3664_1 /TAXON_ID=87120 /ORGANISM="Aurantiochytrium limacinum, Strain ATCCMYA-1381" /LENGTH=198 /DNA_ID=CAMNT_0012054403 /DNA_START=397 /DNA_END=993 /DNA_ORIENTATION=-
MARNESNPNLSQAVRAIGEALSEMEGHREILVHDRIQSSLVQKIHEIDESCNAPTELFLRDRTRSIKSSVKFKQQYDDLAKKQSVNQAKLDKKQKKAQDEEKRLRTMDKDLQQNLTRYEEKRVLDCKLALEEFVKGQLTYHCRAIETLSNALKSVNRIDPALGIERLCEDLDMCPRRGSNYHINLKDLKLVGESKQSH